MARCQQLGAPRACGGTAAAAVEGDPLFPFFAPNPGWMHSANSEPSPRNSACNCERSKPSGLLRGDPSIHLQTTRSLRSRPLASSARHRCATTRARAAAEARPLFQAPLLGLAAALRLLDAVLDVLLRTRAKPLTRRPKEGETSHKGGSCTVPCRPPGPMAPLSEPLWPARCTLNVVPRSGRITSKALRLPKLLL